MELKKELKFVIFLKKTQLVPEIDKSYIFDETTTLSILAGFNHNKRVLIQGLHGTGKSTHIEQIAARLNWPCLRINLDGHISRFDLLGKDAITIKDQKQVTTFKQGMLPWSIENPVALVFDEYDAGRPDVMFVIQRLLESDGKLTLLDQNKVITPNPLFRIFGTCNTLGTGDMSGLYHGTQNLNQGQLDRWNIFTTLDFMNSETEVNIIKNKLGKTTKKIKDEINNMVKLANLVRKSFSNNDISTIISPRTSIIWAQNIEIFDNTELAFKLTFLINVMKVIKKLSLNYIKDVLGKNLTKTQNKEEILNNQKIVANSLSNSNYQTLKKITSFNNNPFEKNETSIDNRNLKITRGWFDFKAINLRYINENIFNKFYPKNNNQQKLYKLLNYSRSIYLSYEYKGCKINIKKYFDQT